MAKTRRTHGTDSHERVIVKVHHLKADQCVIYGEHHAGMQYRRRHSMPPHLLALLDQGEPVFAFAYVDRHSGRWRLLDVAPAQAW